MCSICDGSETISRTVDLSKDKELQTSLRYDSEHNQLLKVRVQLGSFGYTLPIQANFCFICGRDLRKEVDAE